MIYLNFFTLPLFNRIRGGFLINKGNHIIGGLGMGLSIAYSLPIGYKTALIGFACFYLFYICMGWFASLDPYIRKRNETKVPYYMPILNYGYEHIGIVATNCLGLALKGALSFGGFGLWFASLSLPISYLIGHNPDLKVWYFLNIYPKNKKDFPNVAEWLFGLFLALEVIIKSV